MRAEAVGGSAPSSLLLRLACAPARSLPCSLFLPGRRRARLWSVAGGGTAWPNGGLKQSGDVREARGLRGLEHLWLGRVDRASALGMRGDLTFRVAQASLPPSPAGSPARRRGAYRDRAR